ncbi:unnamed protein product [Calypogeia fissa]
MRGSSWTQKFLPALLILVALMVEGTLGNPTNLVINGDFENLEWLDKSSQEYDSSDNKEITTDMMDFIPFFTVVHRGVQLVRSDTYHAPGVLNSAEGLISCHMNSHQGPGVLHTVPMPTPRKGAPYFLRFKIADNPDGGALVKTMKLTILVNNRVSHPKIKPFQVSSPYSTPSTLAWSVQNLTFVGTGASTKLQFESLEPGSFGPIIDNISVTLQTLVENGSFEDATVSQNNLTRLAIISAPSQVIPGWSVTSGMVSWRSTAGFQLSSDRSLNFIDLNAEAIAGTIASNPFTTKRGKKYQVLFDTAANAENVPMLKGYMSASAFSYPGRKLLASRYVFVSAEGFQPQNLGWATYVLEFEAHGTQCFVQFSSHIQGTWNGPVLDSVIVYEVHKPPSVKHIAPTWSAGKHLKPSIWTTSLTAVLVVMSVLGHFRSEIMLFLHT